MSPSARHRKVVALAYDGLCTFEFGITAEVFALKRPELRVPWYDFQVASADRGPLRALGGVQVLVDGGLELLEKAGTIIIPGWKGADAPVPDRVCQALVRAHTRGCRIASICSGAFVLAAAGLLNGRRATTHWRYVNQLRERYPDVTVEPNVLYVDDDDVMTSAGSAAGIDLLLYLVRKDYGATVGNAVARRLVTAPHREGGQAQFIAESMPLRPRNSYGALLEYLTANLRRTHTLSELATRMNVSERTLIRGFRNATGVSPIQWVILARVRRAQELLESSRQTIESISQEVGFGAVETLRHHFRRATGTSPVAFRRAFSR